MVKLTREEMLQLDVEGNVKLWSSIYGVEETFKLLGGPKKVLEIIEAEKTLKALGAEKAFRTLGAEKAMEIFGVKKVLKILGPEKAMQVLGPEKALEILEPGKALRVLGAEKAMQVIGPEKVMKVLIDHEGAEGVIALVKRGLAAKEKHKSKRARPFRSKKTLPSRRHRSRRI